MGTFQVMHLPWNLPRLKIPEPFRVLWGFGLRPVDWGLLVQDLRVFKLSVPRNHYPCTTSLPTHKKVARETRPQRKLRALDLRLKPYTPDPPKTEPRVPKHRRLSTPSQTIAMDWQRSIRFHLKS